MWRIFILGSYLTFLSVNFQRCYLSFEVTDDVTEETQRDGVRRLLLHPLISSEEFPRLSSSCFLFSFIAALHGDFTLYGMRMIRPHARRELPDGVHHPCSLQC